MSNAENTQQDDRYTADLPPSKPMMEVDEASGMRMVHEAQQAVHVLGRAATKVGEALVAGAAGDHIKLGFDFDMSQAYVELDLRSIYYGIEGGLLSEGLKGALENFTQSFGQYVSSQTDVDTSGRPRTVYQHADTDTVRLYLHSIGR